MTWVVGASTSPPVATLIADLRLTITRTDGAKLRVDCLRKIRAISSRMQMAFAGDVQLGFRLADALWWGFGWQHESDQRFDVEYVMEVAGEGCRTVARILPDLHADVLITGLFRDSRMSDDQAYCLRLLGPDYVAEPPMPNKVHSIGAGGDRPEATALQPIFDGLLEQKFDAPDPERALRQQWHQFTLGIVGAYTNHRPVDSVSPTLIQGVVDHNVNIVQSSRYYGYAGTIFRAPPLQVRTWDELLAAFPDLHFEDGGSVDASRVTLEG